jgi:hypothetical protein
VVNLRDGHAELLNVVINPQGRIAFPEAGTIDALVIARTQSVLQRALKFQNEYIEISLDRLHIEMAYAGDQVQKTGACERPTDSPRTELRIKSVLFPHNQIMFCNSLEMYL